jgi:osmotically inducible protein OsmC
VSTATIDPVYTANVTVSGGREGRATSDDGVLDVALRRPKTNGTADGTNPEQLFAAAYAACFQSALLGAARRAGHDASGSTVDAAVSLGKEESGAYGLAVTLTVRIPDLDVDAVQALANDAHETCPYSRATRGNILVEVIAAG